MTILKKSKRHSLYKKALKIAQERVKKNFRFGVCLILHDLWKGNWHSLLENFPEFANKKPTKRYSNMWWKENKDGDKQRILALKRCIKETMPPTKK